MLSQEYNFQVKRLSYEEDFTFTRASYLKHSLFKN